MNANYNQQNSYDQLAYESLSIPLAHPAHLSTIAQLFGMQPAAVDTCRVLELGCASGGNLIPLAEALPNSEFVGIDLSANQIQFGQNIISELKFGNIKLSALNVTEIGNQFGQFDYIIAHGLYSWVPEEVREQILSLCRELLTENGIAYISYNTFPGWHINGMIREMMLFHSNRFDDPKQKLQQARSLIEFLAVSMPKDNPYGNLLVTQLNEIKKSKDDYLFHEYLEQDNQPLYFNEFIIKAMDHGLQYLGDGDFPSMFTSNLPPDIASKLEHVASDQISMEQYIDFLRNRTFRQSLLIHQEQTIDRTLNPENISNLYVASSARPQTAKLDLSSDRAEIFRVDSNSLPFSIKEPISKAAMLALAEYWPRSFRFDDLFINARDRLKAQAGNVADETETQLRTALATELQRIFALGLVELSSLPRLYSSAVSNRPIASGFARLQAKTSTTITNRKHQSVKIDEIIRQLLLLCDGSRDLDNLTDALIVLLSEKNMAIQEGGRPVTDKAKIRAIIRNTVDKNLVSMAQIGFLID